MTNTTESDEKRRNPIERATARVDETQQRIVPLAFAFGVVKKYGDDRAGSLAALISYYGFFSIFPLLMVFTTVLGWVLRGNDQLLDSVTNSALAKFPVVGDQIAESVGSVQGGGVAFAVGLLLALWAGLAATEATSTAMNVVFDVPMSDRPPFVMRKLRGLLTLVVAGASIVAVTVLGSVGITQWFGPLGAVGWFFVQVALNALLIGSLFRVLAGDNAAWSKVWPGMLLGGFGWTLLQVLGGTYVSGILTRASRTYGLFAVVIGLLSWIYLQAQILLYSAEVSTVWSSRLWPRAIVRERPTDADHRAEQTMLDRERRLVSSSTSTSN